MSHLIREWTPEDLPAVQHVLMTTWLDAYSRFIPEEDMRTYFHQHYGLQSLQALFHAPGVSGCVAEVDGVVVGVAKLQFNFQERRFYVSSLYILPEYQGRGLGMELMRAAEKHAVAYNVDEIWLGVMTDNKPALEWYRKMGFRFVDEQPFTMGETTIPHLIGFKKIAPSPQEPLAADRLFAEFGKPGAMDSLPDLVTALLRQQKSSWPQLIGGYEALKTVRQREVQCGEYSVYLQFNPRRIVSSDAKVDAQSIRTRPCFLCVDHLPAEQKGVLYGGEFLVLCNPAPILDRHYTISHIRHIRQAIEPFLGTLLKLARDLSPHFTVFYNGPRSGASAPDHMHFQAGPRGVVPIERDAEVPARRNLRMHIGRVAIISLIGVGRQVILLEGENAEEVQTALLRLLSAMRRVLNIADEPMVNILCSYTGATWRLIVFPRRKHRPDVYFNKGEDRILISPASIDIGGLIVTPIEKDFKTVDAVIIQRIFDEICLEGEVLDKVLEAMR